MVKTVVILVILWLSLYYASLQSWGLSPFICAYLDRSGSLVGRSRWRWLGFRLANKVCSEPSSQKTFLFVGSKLQTPNHYCLY